MQTTAFILSMPYLKIIIAVHSCMLTIHTLSDTSPVPSPSIYFFGAAVLGAAPGAAVVTTAPSLRFCTPCTAIT